MALAWQGDTIFAHQKPFTPLLSCMNHVTAYSSPFCFCCLQAARSSWQEVWSEDLSRLYYYNPETREVSLDQPAGLVRQPGQGNVEV